MKNLQVLFAPITLAYGIHGLIGYDCRVKYLNVTSLSLRDVGECEVPDSPINTTLKYVQLRQLNEYKETTVIQCKVEVHRTVYYCGAFSHISLVVNGENEYLLRLVAQRAKIYTNTEFLNSQVI